MNRTCVRQRGKCGYGDTKRRSRPNRKRIETVTFRPVARTARQLKIINRVRAAQAPRDDVIEMQMLTIAAHRISVTDPALAALAPVPSPYRLPNPGVLCRSVLADCGTTGLTPCLRVSCGACVRIRLNQLQGEAPGCFDEPDLSAGPGLSEHPRLGSEPQRPRMLDSDTGATRRYLAHMVRVCV